MKPLRFQFRLYIAGNALNSAKAVANLNLICRTYLPGRHETEIVDVFQDPGRALADGILLTPTLVKVTPSPVRVIVGTLSDMGVVLEALGLDADAAA